MGEMSKSPEEIKNFETKKELAYVAFGKVLYEGWHKIAAKALALIQRLEAQNAELVRETEQLERERDAAVTDIHKTCSTCKHYYYNRQDDDSADCLWLDGCKNEDHWEWRGVQEQSKQEGENDDV